MNKTDHGKTALITGGRGYLGQHIVQELSRAGYGVHVLGCDITDDAEVMKEAEHLAKEWGSLGLVVHCAAAPLDRRPVGSQDEASFRRQFDVQVLGAERLMKHFAPHMNHGGHFVGISSRLVHDKKPARSGGAYMATKYALEGFLRAASYEFGPRGISVFALAPGFMPGGLNKDIPGAAMKLIMDKSAPEEVTRPEEVAAALMTLIARDRSETNGKSFTIPGLASFDL